jgi:FkbM family methyltransferase
MEVFGNVKNYFRYFLAKMGISIKRESSYTHISTDHPGFCVNPHEIIYLDFDFIVRDYLSRLEEPGNVTFLQVGAMDGETADPLQDYVRRYEWRGLLIEPQSYYFEQLQDTYADQENLEFFNGAVDHDSGFRTLYTVDQEADNLPKWTGGFASFDRSHLSSRGLEEWIREERVPVEHPMDLLERSSLTDIDIVQIDVEGFDAEVVRMLDFEKITPSIVQFEHNHLSSSDHIDVVDMLTSNGYGVAQGGPGSIDTIAYRRPKK